MKANDEVIIIDEPELSLHPSLQKRLTTVLNEYSQNRQIIIATHSPYFVDLHNLQHGAALVRVISGKTGTEIFQLSNTKIINKLLSNQNNPHILGLDAKELFFLEDKIILVEGQEDVIFLPKILKELDLELIGNIFGWGTGGAGNILHLCAILQELGFKKVVGIFDNDKAQDCQNASEQFSSYKFYCIPAADIRTKPAREVVPKKEGLLEDSNTSIRQEHKQPTFELLTKINTYLQD